MKKALANKYAVGAFLGVLGTLGLYGGLHLLDRFPSLGARKPASISGVTIEAETLERWTGTTVMKIYDVNTRANCYALTRSDGGAAIHCVR